jgi:riboflavin kinase/FMN adenylyltransferase
VIEGVVVRGDQRGRELGFPTANVEADSANGELPPDGVYAGWVETLGPERHVAAISIGGRPTYYGAAGRRLVEAFLLDYEGDLYGQRLRIGLGPRVRGQARFDSESELIETMRRDIESVRRIAEKWTEP